MACTERCRWCVYFETSNVIGPHCSYILITGHSRGCPPGDDCTAFKKAKEKNTAGAGWYGMLNTKDPKIVEREKTFAEMYRDGKRDKEIARATGVNPSTVRKWRIRHGLPTQQLIGGH